MSWMWWLPCKHFTKANQCTCCFVDMFSIHDKLINNMAMDERVATHILIYKSYCGLIVSCEDYGVSEPVSWSVRRYDGFSSPAILLSYSPLRQFRQRLRRKTTPTQEKHITWQTIYIYIHMCRQAPVRMKIRWLFDHLEPRRIKTRIYSIVSAEFPSRKCLQYRVQALSEFGSASSKYSYGNNIIYKTRSILNQALAYPYNK